MKSLQPSTAISPVPVVMVSCKQGDKTNITTIAWAGIINSEPPMVYVSIRPSRYSYEIIKQTKQFVINMPDDTLVYQTDYCGTKSGKELDKFETLQLTKQECEKIDCVAIAECPIQLECEVKEIKTLGSHDMFISEVVCVRAKDELVLPNGKIDYANANLLTYLGQEYRVANRQVGKRGICLQ